MSKSNLLSDRLYMAKRAKEDRDGVAYPWAEIAREAGVTRATVSNWISDTNRMRAEHARTLAAWLNVNPVWLETGDGHMEPPRGGASFSFDGSVSIPILGVALDANLGIRQGHSGEIATSVEIPSDILQRASFSKIENLAYLTVAGDAMAPTLNEGDLLIVDTAQSRIGPDAIYVIGQNGRVAVKRIQTALDGSIEVKSDNPLYTHFTIPPDSALLPSILGRVIAHKQP